MTTAIDFGALLLIGAGWFVLAVGVALFFCALFQGAKYRDYSIPPQASDVSYDGQDEWQAYLAELAERKARIEARRRAA